MRLFSWFQIVGTLTLVATNTFATSGLPTETGPVQLTLSGRGTAAVLATAMTGHEFNSNSYTDISATDYSSAGSSYTQLAYAYAGASATEWIEVLDPEFGTILMPGGLVASSVDATVSFGEQYGEAYANPAVFISLDANNNPINTGGFGGSAIGEVNPLQFTGTLEIGSNPKGGFPVGTYLTLDFSMYHNYGWTNVSEGTGESYLMVDDGQMHVVGLNSQDYLRVQAGQILNVQMQLQATDNQTWSGTNLHATGNLVLTGTPWDLGPAVPYAGFGSDSDNGSNAMIVDGVTGGDRMPIMTWTDPVFLPPVTDITVLGDVLNLYGTLDDTIVLQMSYDPALVAALGLQESDLTLMWLDNNGSLVAAVLGNTGGDPLAFQGPYDSLIHGLGSYGIDTDNHIVWAVINHNSQFVVGAQIIPEPATIMLLAPVVTMLVVSRRAPRRDAL